jgi:RNA-directed DNA polymerase
MGNASPTGEALVLPPLVSYSTVGDFKAALRSIGDYDKEYELEIERLTKLGLPPIPSPTALALILGISPKLLTAMALFPRNYYRQFQISKARGGKRTILAPKTYLKTIQKYILRHILETQKLPPHVTGFVRNRSVAQNARIHQKARYLLNVDLKDFFGSVRPAKVANIFRQIGFSYSMPDILSKLCTHNKSLPQGAPTSPYLANLVFLRADAAIKRLCDKLKIKYSRYADDLTFSRSKRFPKDFEERIGAISQRYNFALNHKKTRFSKPGQAKFVTGFVVNEKVQPPRNTRKKIRAMFHQAWRNPQGMVQKRHVLLGWASYVNSYDQAQGARYMKITNAIPKD